MFNPASPVTGSAQTGLTGPTYTLTADKAPDVNATQWAVTALGGTQTGVLASQANAAFTLTCFKPKVLRSAAPIVNGVPTSVPRNVYKFIVRKGGLVGAAGTPYQHAVLTLTCDVPAGMETSDQIQLRAALSLLIGAINNQSSGIGDTLQSGVI